MMWPVFTCATGHELSAASEITALGIEAYCPTVKHITKPKRKSSPAEYVRAAFPGYFFAAPGSRSIDLTATPHLRCAMVRHLRLGDHFCEVDESEIERLRDEDGSRRVVEDEKTKFLFGDRVCVISGPLAGQEGIVESSNYQRSDLVIEGFSAKIQMPNFSLEKIEASNSVR